VNRAEYPVDQKTLTERYTVRALDFIERHREQPFFLYVPHTMPHKPLAVSDAFRGKSGAGLYGDVIAELDAGVGRVLAKLKECGLDERTLVAFTSDNGPWYGGRSGGLRGMKGSSYEGGYRVPCLLRWPGKIAAGQMNDSLAVTMDLFPTVLRAAGLAVPGDRLIDGRDLLSKENAGPRYVVGAQNENLSTIRDDRWKLHLLIPRDPFLKSPDQEKSWKDPRGPDGTTILAPMEQYRPSDYPGLRTGVKPAPMQLFDLQNDPGEQRDVSYETPAPHPAPALLFVARPRRAAESPAHHRGRLHLSRPRRVWRAGEDAASRPTRGRGHEVYPLLPGRADVLAHAARALHRSLSGEVRRVSESHDGLRLGEKHRALPPVLGLYHSPLGQDTHQPEVGVSF
jgi:arylsulfatase A-like enzyme